MSVTIRLARMGRRNAPSFKIVASNTRDKRNGKFLDVLGYFNPSHDPVEYSLDETKFAEWVSKGALVSDAVLQLKEGTYSFTPYDPHGKRSKKEEAKEETKADEKKDAKPEQEPEQDGAELEQTSNVDETTEE